MHCGNCGAKLTRKKSTYCGSCGHQLFQNSKTTEKTKDTEGESSSGDISLPQKIFTCPNCNKRVNELKLHCSECGKKFWQSEEKLRLYIEKNKQLLTGNSNIALHHEKKTKKVLSSFKVAAVSGWLVFVIAVTVLAATGHTDDNVGLVIGGIAFIVGLALFFSLLTFITSLVVNGLRERLKQKAANDKVCVVNSKKRNYAIPGVIVALVGFIALINSGLISGYIDIYPFLPYGEREVRLSCSYMGTPHSVSLRLHKNINNYYYYSQLDLKPAYYGNDEFDRLTFIHPKDKTVDTIVSSVRDIAQANSLNDDQAMELAICFVQNIPYDFEGYDKGNSEDTESFPYETLYKNKGICTGKTYLGAAIISRMGYGTAIFAMPAQSHMALGVSVPERKYADFNSDYAFYEMTAIRKPGLHGYDLDQNGLPLPTATRIAEFTSSEEDQGGVGVSNYLQGVDPKVVRVSGGRAYARIVEVYNLIESLERTLDVIDSINARIGPARSSISYWEREQARAYAEYSAEPTYTQSCSYYSYLGIRCYNAINSLKNIKYSTYTSYYNNYSSAINRYNALISDYNRAVDIFNEFYDRLEGYDYF